MDQILGQVSSIQQKLTDETKELAQQTENLTTRQGQIAEKQQNIVEKQESLIEGQESIKDDLKKSESIKTSKRAMFSKQSSLIGTMDDVTLDNHIKMLQGKQTRTDLENLIPIPEDLSSIQLSVSNPELQAMTTPAQLRQKNSFAGRMNDVHAFAIGQTQLNKRIIEQYEALNSRLI